MLNPSSQVHESPDFELHIPAVALRIHATATASEVRLISRGESKFEYVDIQVCDMVIKKLQKNEGRDKEKSGMTKDPTPDQNYTLVMVTKVFQSPDDRMHSSASLHTLKKSGAQCNPDRS